MYNKNKEKLYIAYGSNLSLEQMARRCPTAEIVGTATLRNWRLWFRGGNRSAVATVEREQGYKVPVLVWRLQPTDEDALDIYEGWPHLYRKETLHLTLDGERVAAMIYIMNESGHPYNTPSAHYFEIIKESYKDMGFDLNILHQAVCDSRKRRIEND